MDVFILSKCMLNMTVVPTAQEGKEGWLWHMGGWGKMSAKEMVEWEAEGKAVTKRKMVTHKFASTHR